MVSDKIWRYLTISFDLLEAFPETRRMDVKEREKEKKKMTNQIWVSEMVSWLNKYLYFKPGFQKSND